MTTRASEDLLDQLHGLQAEALRDALVEAKKSGEYPPQLFAQINKFLKDNGVDRAVTAGDPTDLLADDLPEFDDDGNILEFKSNVYR